MMTSQKTDPEKSIRLAVLAEEIYTVLAEQFPVCLASDEFHFFPQYRSSHPQWDQWDDFSSDAVHKFLARTSRWVEALEGLRPARPGSTRDVDVDLLQKMLITLQEQIAKVRPQQNQPTFYLTIISIGLAEALEASEDAFNQRLMGLPALIQTAIANLGPVPVVFRDLGIDMIAKIKNWMYLLPLSDDAQRTAMDALDTFAEHLEMVELAEDFRLTNILYARIADQHMGCQMGLEEIAWHLDQEIEEAAQLLTQSAARIDPGKPWLSVYYDLPEPAAENNDPATPYRQVIARLKNHCLDHGIIDEKETAGCDVEIQTIPEHMMPVRANAAYSMPPGRPPRGGVFFILPLSRQMIPRDMMLLAAHETFPGHHLLDTHRWRLEKPLRRSLEFPIFYEGWASFAEEILFDTEFFGGPVDRLFMAKRRLWRAYRGRADLRIHTGRSSLEEAATTLAEVGLVTLDKARAMVRRYALKPGYQLAYAIGRRKFRQLYATYLGQGHTPAHFIRKVLGQGEIGFDHLAVSLLNGK